MKPGYESQTAVLVCMGRAAAHGLIKVANFSDPTALALLPQDARERVERFQAGTPPKGIRERLGRANLKSMANLMVARTVAIDEAVRGAGCPQVVILGAGLDGRAWRLPELREAIVFEIDHPDSQREKRARVVGLEQFARDVRFVAVDFSRDSLDAALAEAGHDRERPTTWILEGVVMYLTLAEIESTLAIITRRSAAGSRLVLAYHAPALEFQARRAAHPSRKTWLRLGPRRRSLHDRRRVVSRPRSSDASRSALAHSDRGAPRATGLTRAPGPGTVVGWRFVA